MTARFIVADVFDGLASLETGSVDLVVTSPPFLALRSYLPADHPDKGKEIGSEATPAEFIDTLLKVTAELRRVLAPHGSICVELGDTYAGSGGGGGDYLENGWREGQQQFAGSEASMRESNAAHWRQKNSWKSTRRSDDSPPYEEASPITAWPLAKSRTLIPSLYQIALAYGFNPLTGQPSPAGQWRIRNIITWARPNPPVGALGDKWRPATSDLIIACTSSKRYWDDLATRKPFAEKTLANQKDGPRRVWREGRKANNEPLTRAEHKLTHSGAPLLDYWVIPPGGYTGSHYAVFPEELVVPCVQAMCPQKVCRTCGEPSRRIVEKGELVPGKGWVTPIEDWNPELAKNTDHDHAGNRWQHLVRDGFVPGYVWEQTTTGWTDCGHDDWRPGLVLDPFAGSGTTLAVATGHGHDAIGIDIDSRNAELARDRVGPFLFDMV